LGGKLFGLPGQSMLYFLDLIGVFPAYLDSLCVLPYNPQRKDQTHDIESGEDNEKNVQCFRLHFSFLLSQFFGGGRSTGDFVN
jgi:hypothetical protein